MVQKESCFALHGGTALNFFILDMPRLSVDIDLIYCPIHESLGQGIHHINQALTRIVRDVASHYPTCHIRKKYKSSKLYLEKDGLLIKIEPNKFMRGTILKPQIKSLTPKTA